MRTLLASTALLFAIVTASQAAACDMGAIETWVAAVCERDGCETKSIGENLAAGCNGSNCTKRYSVERAEPNRRLTTIDSPSKP